MKTAQSEENEHLILCESNSWYPSFSSKKHSFVFYLLKAYGNSLEFLN